MFWGTILKLQRGPRIVSASEATQLFATISIIVIIIIIHHHSHYVNRHVCNCAVHFCERVVDCDCLIDYVIDRVTDCSLARVLR